MKKKLMFFLTALCSAATFAQEPLIPDPAGDDPPAVVIVTEEFRTQLAAVSFEENSTELTPLSSAALDSISAVLKQSPQHRYEVHGHSCADAGSGQTSAMRFSVQRVEAMVNYLMTNGVPATNIVTIINPVSAADCARDRRVEIMSVETRQVERPNPARLDDGRLESERLEPVVGATAPVARDAITTNLRPDPTPIAPPVPTDPTAPDKQTVAIYMAGEEPEGARGVHNIMGGELARTLSESDRYLAVDRTEAILDQLAREHIYQRSGAVDDEQIKALGQQLGVQYLCISDINAVGKRYYLDTRLVDVVTAEILRSVTATSTLKHANEMARVARNIALELLEADKTREQRAKRKKIFRYTAIGLDILGAGAFAYGYFYENNNVINEIENNDGPEADRAATRRNVGYIVGGALIATGVSFHIFF